MEKEKLQQYAIVALVGIASGAIGGIFANNSHQQSYEPSQSAVVLRQTQPTPQLVQPDPIKKENSSEAKSLGGNANIPNAQHGESSAESTNKAIRQLEIATVNYDMLMSAHPLIKEAKEIMQKDFEEAKKTINELPENERNEAWQKHQDEVMEKIQKEYVQIARQQIEAAIDTVLAEKGLKTCMVNALLIRGGIDITNDVKNVLGE